MNRDQVELRTDAISRCSEDTLIGRTKADNIGLLSAVMHITAPFVVDDIYFGTDETQGSNGVVVIAREWARSR
jgi:hypothetical protein